MRKTIDFNNNWKFQKPGENPVTVQLPHTWNAQDGQDGGNDYWRGTAVYEKAFSKPILAVGERVYLELNGAAMTAEVFLNGKQLVRHEGGYSTFRVELTGEHTIIAQAGECSDTMTIRKVDVPDPSYRFAQAGSVGNWFDEASFKSDRFSIRDGFGTLMAHPATGKIVGAIMQKIIESRGDVAKSANKNASLQQMIAGMSFEALLKKAGDVIPQDVIRQVNEQLQQIPKC